ncbi:alpha/beta fold hydrolase [Actinoplanes utahensis]|uniref:Aminopeptidase n=2 Tax=Actinoplanes utahensis TaxID=1869 RepID=A0A0A6WX14_ACTUT|nr:alpha/beta hydrolase [Actinoplanes utahensis]KHD72237.1 aminopeptidase [Actinoplanes utahensis]
MTTYAKIGAFLLAAGWGLIAASWTPRGPLTGAEALWSVAVSAGAGFLAGWTTRSRWAIIGAPLTFAVVFELARATATGPSVDAPHPSIMGILVLVTGRGVHALLSLLPMAVAAAFAHRRPAARRWRRVTGRIALGLATVVTVAFAVAAAVPARTEPISGGVAELAHVGGLGVMIRGASPSLPLLLYVPGPPGGSATGTMRGRLAALERRFVVATMDRRGAEGRAPELTVDSETADVLTVTDHLRKRFGQDRITLVGHSGGSIPAVLAVQRHPERYRAYVGTGQAVDLRASDRIFYTDVLAWARSGGRSEVVAQLERQGPPPWDDAYDYEPFHLHAAEAYGVAGAPVDIGAGEYTLLAKAHTMTRMLDTWDALYPRMQDTDLRREVPALAVPAYFVQGGREMRGLAEPFAAWYAALESPDKRLVTFPAAGHHPMSEDPDRFVSTLTELLA